MQIYGGVSTWLRGQQFPVTDCTAAWYVARWQAGYTPSPCLNHTQLALVVFATFSCSRAS